VIDKIVSLFYIEIMSNIPQNNPASPMDFSSLPPDQQPSAPPLQYTDAPELANPSTSVSGGTVPTNDQVQKVTRNIMKRSQEPAAQESKAKKRKTK